MPRLPPPQHHGRRQQHGRVRALARRKLQKIPVLGWCGIALILAGCWLAPSGGVPSVTSITPTMGATDGTDIITIDGSAFGGAPTGSIGGVACTSSTASSTTRLLCQSPAGTGTGFSVVVTDTGTSNGANALFSYKAPTINTITPTVASTGVLTIVGSNFGTVSGMTGSVGGINCAPLTYISDTQTTCGVPSSCGGSKNVIMTVTGQTSLLGLGQFSYTLPAVSSASPSSGTTGDTITLLGSDFGPAGCPDTVTLGTTDCTTTTLVTSTELQCVAPAGAASQVDITVTVWDQTTVYSNGWIWLSNECLGSPCAATATCTDLAVGYSCACNTNYVGDGYSCDPNECALGWHNCTLTCVDLQPGYKCVGDATENGLTGAGAAAAATAVVGAAVVVAIVGSGSSAMIASGAGAGAAAGGGGGGGAAGASGGGSGSSGGGGNLFTLLDQIQMMSIMSMMDVAIPDSLRAFGSGMLWSSGMLTQYVIPGPFWSVSARRRLLGSDADDDPNQPAEMITDNPGLMFYHQLLSLALLLFWLVVIHVTVIYVLCPLGCRILLCRKKFKLDAAFLFPGMEIALLMVAYQGVALSTVRLLFNAGSADLVLVAVACVVCGVLVIPLPFVVMGFTFFSIRIHRKAKYVRDEYPRWVKRLLQSRFLRWYLCARGHWVTTDKFRGRYGALFMNQSRMTYLYVGAMMVAKLLRAVVVGCLVGVLEGKLQIGFMIALQGSRWLWLCFRFTSTSRSNDVKGMFFGLLELVVLAILSTMPVKGTYVNTAEYATRVQIVLFLSLFTIYTQVVPMLFLGLWQAAEIMWNQFRARLCRRRKKVGHTALTERDHARLARLAQTDAHRRLALHKCPSAAMLIDYRRHESAIVKRLLDVHEHWTEDGSMPTDEDGLVFDRETNQWVQLGRGDKVNRFTQCTSMYAGLTKRRKSRLGESDRTVDLITSIRAERRMRRANPAEFKRFSLRDYADSISGKGTAEHKRKVRLLYTEYYEKYQEEEQIYGHAGERFYCDRELAYISRRDQYLHTNFHVMSNQAFFDRHYIGARTCICYALHELTTRLDLQACRPLHQWAGLKCGSADLRADMARVRAVWAAVPLDQLYLRGQHGTADQLARLVADGQDPVVRGNVRYTWSPVWRQLMRTTHDKNLVLPFDAPLHRTGSSPRFPRMFSALLSDRRRSTESTRSGGSSHRRPGVSVRMVRKETPPDLKTQ